MPEPLGLIFPQAEYATRCLRSFINLVYDGFDCMEDAVVVLKLHDEKCEG